MAAHLILIPGFGMKAADLGLVSNLKEFEPPVLLDPDWNGFSDLPAVAEELASKINDVYAQAGKQPTPRQVILYGFSLGGDLIMEMVNRNLLDIGEDGFLILADPNVNAQTCFVTRLAAQSPELADFLNALTVHANGPGAIQQSKWLVYQEAVARNTRDSTWLNLRNIAKSVLTTVDQRYADFKAIVSTAGKTPKGAQVQMLLSEEGEVALAAASPSYELPSVFRLPKGGVHATSFS
jgi:hypothetical protein